MRKLLISRQTHYTVLIWTFTWFAYWLFFKNQVVAVNIAGVAASASLIAFMRFSSARSMATKALKFAAPQVNKSAHIPRMTLTSHLTQNAETYQPKPIPSLFAGKNAVAAKSPISRPVQTQKPTVHLVTVNAVVEPLEHEVKPLRAIEKTASQITSNGCPKNLEYYTKKPRPKQTPAECFSCKNLISCVCQTSN